MAAKSLFDLKRGESVSGEQPATGGSSGGNPGPSVGGGRPESSAETISIGAAFGPSAGDAPGLGDTDPDAPFGRFPDGTPRKRRARAGTGNSAANATTTKTSDLAGIESLLMSVHMMGAIALKSPSFAISELEAKRLAKAVAEVQAQYPLVIDAKTQAWFNLAAIAGIIYVPRVIAVANTAKAAKIASKRAPQAPASTQSETAPEFSQSPQVDPREPQTPSQLYGPGYSGGAE